MPPPPPTQPITRREQIELDELLGDIYRGIETLPDRSRTRSGFIAADSYDIVKTDSRDGHNKLQPRVIGRAHVREYELPESSPLVQRHKQEVAALRHENPYDRRPGQTNVRYADGPTTGVESGARRGGSDQRQQSLSSFMHENPVGSVTPDQKRRVRILDPPSRSRNRDEAYDDNDDDDYPAQDYYNETSPSPNRQLANGAKHNKKHRTAGNNKERVKYVNTNKFLYHQERNPDDEPLENLSDLENDNILRPADDNDDDIDGVTRVEYYHTSWLDRQLGRATKRRSSKELTERQAKEKAMIEELKRNLKNGAITLRQSFKGKKSNKSAKNSDIFADDQFLDTTSHYNTAKQLNSNKSKVHHEQRIKDSPSRVISSGLATIPRNYNIKSAPKSSKAATNTRQATTVAENRSRDFHSGPYDQSDSIQRDVNQQREQQKFANQPMQARNYNNPISQTPQHNYLSTLPNKSAGQHQLLQSHYRGNLRDKTNTLPHQLSPRPSPSPAAHAPIYSNQSVITASPATADRMKFTGYNNNNNNNCAQPQRGGAKSPIQQQIQASNTISGIPSATEVVRSALSRSGSQVSLNQLNKTINLIPNSPPGPSPMTPTQQLKAASPSLSPSPTQHCSPSPAPASSYFPSKTLGHKPASANQYLPGQVVVHGTRTVGRPPQQPTPSSQPQHQQPVYANPHTAFMQHRMEQQMKQPNRNVSSIREFNELDSLLRSLSPGIPSAQTRQPQAYTQTQTQITPGYSVKPSQPSFGGYMPTNQQQTTTSSAPRPYATDVYAQVQKQPQQQVGAGITGLPQTSPATHQPFTVDVTDKKFDENCRQRQAEALSEFETPIELVPAMEDYQNISKLNPVKNYYWYKPNMTRDRAIDLLKDKPQGTFIVRDSTSFRGAYGLALKVSKLPKNILASLRNYNGDPSAEYIRHFLIEPTGSGVRLKGYANEPVFDSLPDLIYQHSLTELALPCKLIIPRADIEDPRFNQKQKQFFDEFIASKERAKHQPYERTSPDGGYRKYPGDVYVHNEHRIIFQ